jgi:hypothetical protein
VELVSSDTPVFRWIPARPLFRTAKHCILTIEHQKNYFP